MLINDICDIFNFSEIWIFSQISPPKNFYDIKARRRFFQLLEPIKNLKPKKRTVVVKKRDQKSFFFLSEQAFVEKKSEVGFDSDYSCCSDSDIKNLSVLTLGTWNSLVMRQLADKNVSGCRVCPL